MRMTEIETAAAAIAAGPWRERNTHTLLPSAQGYFSDAEGVAFGRLAAAFPRVLEIGSWKGRSTSFAAIGGAEAILAIDTWAGDDYAGRGDFWPEFAANMKRLPARCRVMPLRADFRDALPLVDIKMFDLIHYDADHDSEPTEAALETIAWRTSGNAVLCVHDIDYPNVAEIVNRYAAAMGRTLVVADRLGVLLPTDADAMARAVAAISGP